jgi:CMP-N-acetylneuraminic acid synthetase
MAADSNRIVALVPMRHSSERVPGKNYRPLGGRPLFHHIVESLLASELVASVVIDTDSDLISAEVSETFPDVTVLSRPESLLGGDVPMNDILLHDVSCIDADYYLQTHSTNPFLRASTIDAALREFLDQRGRYDSLFSVTPLQTRLWWPDGSAVNHDPQVLLRTQDLPPILEENSCLYVFDRATLERRKNRIGDRPLLYRLDPAEAIDIDDERDWKIAESLYETSGGGR